MNYTDTRPKTIVCDIDGTLVKHAAPIYSARSDHKMELLPGTLDKLIDWDKKGYYIILLTGRKESLRNETKRQLSEVGIIYDQLVMGIGGVKIYLVNDCKPNGDQTAFAFNLVRNKGINDLDI